MKHDYIIFKKLLGFERWRNTNNNIEDLREMNIKSLGYLDYFKLFYIFEENSLSMCFLNNKTDV
jgi:hypothetical protein